MAVDVVTWPDGVRTWTVVWGAVASDGINQGPLPCALTVWVWSGTGWVVQSPA